MPVAEVIVLMKLLALQKTDQKDFSFHDLKLELPMQILSIFFRILFCRKVTIFQKT